MLLNSRHKFQLLFTCLMTRKSPSKQRSRSPPAEQGKTLARMRAQQRESFAEEVLLPGPLVLNAKKKQEAESSGTEDERPRAGVPHLCPKSSARSYARLGAVLVLLL